MLMASLHFWYCLLLYQTFLSNAQDIPLPIQVPPSNVHYGPDGPWQAVSVAFGSPAQQLDLYPGSTFETILLSTDVCKEFKQPCGAGGLYDPQKSQTGDDSSIGFLVIAMETRSTGLLAQC